MGRDSIRINFSIHPKDIKDINDIKAELKNRKRKFSATMCQLLKQFRDDGYRLKNEEVDK